MKNEKPRVVKIHDVQIDSNYVQWLGEIKSRYRSAQIKAAVKVNAEQLLFNWQLGRDLVTRKADYSGINVPLVAVCNVPPVAQCNVPLQKWLQ